MNAQASKSQIPQPVSRVNSLFAEIKAALADNSHAIEHLRDQVQPVSQPIPAEPSAMVGGAHGIHAEPPASPVVEELRCILSCIRAHTDRLRAISAPLEI